MSAEQILVWIVIGGIAGILAEALVGGLRSGLIGAIVVGILGAIIYLVARDQFSGITPAYWYFWIGLLLVLVVMFLPNGILGGLSALNKRAE